MQKLSKEEGLRLAGELRSKMSTMSLGDASKAIVNLFKNETNIIDESFAKILREYGVNLEEIDLRGESLCENGKNPPLEVALQTFYASLHPRLKGKDLNLEGLDLKDEPHKVVDSIIRQGINDLGIETTTDNIFIGFKMGLENLLVIVNEPEIKKQLIVVFDLPTVYGDTEKVIIENFEYIIKEEGLETLRTLAQTIGLENFLLHSVSVKNAISLLKEKNGLLVLRKLSGGIGLDSLLRCDECVNNLKEILKEADGLIILKELYNTKGMMRHILVSNEYISNFKKLLEAKNGLDVIRSPFITCVGFLDNIYFPNFKRVVENMWRVLLELRGCSYEIKKFIECDECITNLEKLLKEKNGLEAFKLIKRNENFPSILRNKNSMNNLKYLLETEYGLEILETFAISVRLESLLENNDIELEYSKIQEKFEIIDGDIEF